MNVKQATRTGLLVMALQAIMCLPVMAQSIEIEEIDVETASTDEVSVCVFIEENWESFKLPSEQFECSDVTFFDKLPLEDRKQLLLEISQIKTLDEFAEFWQFYEFPPIKEAVQKTPVSKAASGQEVYSGGVEQWRGLVAKYFMPGDVDHAMDVIYCETGGSGYPGELNDEGSGASGLFQHMPQYWAERSALAGFEGASIFDPEANVGVAAWLVYNQGWWHWPNCG